MSQDRLEDFDKILRSHFADHEMEVSPMVWRKIENRSKKKKNYYLFIFLLLTPIFIGLSILSFRIKTKEFVEIKDPLETKVELEKVSLQENSSKKIVAAAQNYNDSSLKTNDHKRKSEQNLKIEVIDKNDLDRTSRFDAPPQIISQFGEQDVAQSLEESLSSEINDEVLEDRHDIKYDYLTEKEEFDLNESLQIDAMTRELTLIKNQDFPLSFSHAKVVPSHSTSSWSIEMGAGLALSFHTLSSKINDDAYLQARLETEEALENVGASIKLKRIFNNKLTTSFGLNLTNFNYRYTFIDTLERVERLIRIDTFYSSNGQNRIVDSLMQVEFGTSISENYNNHYLYSIPLSIGYQFKIQRLMLEPYGGLTLNWRQSVYGDISSTQDLRPMNISTHGGSSIVYKNKLDMIYHLGLTLGVQVGNNIALILQPEYHHVMKPITNNDYQVSETRNWLNINLGIRFNIWSNTQSKFK